MQLSPLQFKVIERIANSSDGDILASILEDIIKEISDIRKLDSQAITVEEMRARQIACTFIEKEVIDRLKIKKGKVDENLDSFE